MSLPSVVVFYKNEIEVKREFINCGWICNPNTIKSGIKRTLSFCESFDWDVAEAYGLKISKEDFEEVFFKN